MRKINKIHIFFLVIFLIQIFYLFQFRSNFKYEVIKSAFQPNSGVEFAVTPEVIDSNKILKNNKVNKFNLSKFIRKDIYLYQRIIEFNYPIRINNSTNIYIYLLKEKISDNCEIIDTSTYLKLANCL